MGNCRYQEVLIDIQTVCVATNMTQRSRNTFIAPCWTCCNQLLFLSNKKCILQKVVGNTDFTIGNCFGTFSKYITYYQNSKEIPKAQLATELTTGTLEHF
jgi:hypothetical protein